MINRMIAVIFDMDGVIVHNDIYHFRAWEDFCKKYSLGVSLETVKSWFGNTNPMILKNLFGENIDEEMIEKLGMEKEKIYRDLYGPDIKLCNGLDAFLDNLKENNVIIAIATSAPAVNVDFVIEHTGIQSYFDKIIDSSYIKEGKPSPEIYLKTAEVLQMKPSECLVFEDSFHGIESARRAGMKVVGVATTHPAEKLKGTVRNITDFTQINFMDVKNIIQNSRS